MPASPWEIEQALDEGVEMHYSWGPRRVIGDNGQVAGLELVRCTSVFDEEGNFCPFFDDSRLTIEADQIIIAVGQTSETAFCRDFCFLDEHSELPVQKGLIAIEPETQQTEVRGVFAGGDAANGPGTVIQAIAAGRRAAASIDRYLGGDGIIECGRRNAEGGFAAPKPQAKAGWGEGGKKPEYDGKREQGFAELPRCEMPSLPVSERRASFDEVERGCDEQPMLAEVGRCLQCDLEICLAVAKRRAATDA
jgi:hypothetical protein